MRRTGSKCPRVRLWGPPSRLEVKLTFLILGLIGTNVAHAATVSVEVRSGEQPALVRVDGKLEFGDGDRFRYTTAFLSSAIVSFSSNGGSVAAGIQIGEIIRSKGFTTSVSRDAPCASACAIAWLGGTKRLMSAESKIGFHAAYTADGRETGVGNAVIGAYLNKIGLPNSAVAYITQAAPRSMTWLSPAEAKKHGIDVELVGSSQLATAPAPVIVSAAPVVPSATPPPTKPSQLLGQQDCVAEFARLRVDVQKKGLAAKAAGERKASREEMCQHITAYSSVESKWVQFTESNVTLCGIPADVLQTLKDVHRNTEQTRNKICARN
jgi:hypothetical protein